MPLKRQANGLDKRERERETETETETDRDKQTDRQTDRDRQRMGDGRETKIDRRGMRQTKTDR